MKFNKNNTGINRIANFIFGVILGIGLFFGSFIVLWINEGRVDLATIADDSIPVSADAPAAEYEGELVAASGVLHSDEQLGDPGTLKAGSYLQLDRKVEMYAWEEHDDTDEDGDREYSYTTGWTAHPEDSSGFAYRGGHENPAMPVEAATLKVHTANIGAFRVNPEALFIMQPPPLSLKPGMVENDIPVENNFIFIGRGRLSRPEVGDIRISYRAFANDQEATLFGRQSELSLVPYEHRDGTLLFRAYALDRESAITAMHEEYVLALWVLRAVGFMMMWVGMLLALSPLTKALDLLPVIGDFGIFVIAAITLGVALTLSLITIVVAAILHNIMALTILLLLLVGGALLWRKRRRGTAVSLSL